MKPRWAALAAAGTITLTLAGCTPSGSGEAYLEAALNGDIQAAADSLNARGPGVSFYAEEIARLAATCEFDDLKADKYGLLNAYSTRASCDDGTTQFFYLLLDEEGNFTDVTLGEIG